MSTGTLCDGPGCTETTDQTGPVGQWLRLYGGEINGCLDFHSQQCLENHLTPMTETYEDDNRITTRVTLEGQAIGSNPELGVVFFRGADVGGQHHPWIYQLHWSTEFAPVAGS